ncbi:MAG TPA: dienelactone hydrolase family protein [Kofleriaceae bacterium]
MRTTRLELAGLSTHIVGPSDAAATCVLLHGFGAPGDDLLGLAAALDAPVRFVVPAAPLELGGLYGDSRAWWLIDLMQLEDELRRGVARDRRDEVPDGLPEARRQMTAFVDELSARFSIAADRLVLGGFSQGAMLALDVALHRETVPAGLVLMSGTLIAASVWQARMASLAHVPVMLSHGRQDGLLPFSAAEVLRDRLTAAGADVDWVPFMGAHEIPPVVLEHASALLHAVAARGARPA